MDSIERNTKIYQDSFDTYGDDPRSCHWESSVIFQYDELTKSIDLNGSSVLEVGCGIGGFYDYCINQKGIKDFTYQGIDLVKGMIDLAQKKYPKAKFNVCNILEQPVYGGPFDYVILCGIFNMATRTEDMKKILAKSFEYCTKGMIFNFISTYVNFIDETMSYHNPQDILKFCIENLSRKVNMNHHYGKCDVSTAVYR